MDNKQAIQKRRKYLPNKQIIIGPTSLVTKNENKKSNFFFRLVSEIKNLIILSVDEDLMK